MDALELGIRGGLGGQPGPSADRREQVDPRAEPQRRQRMVRSEVVGKRAWPEHQEGAGIGGRATGRHVDDDTAPANATANNPVRESRPLYHPRMDLIVVLIIALVLVIMWRGPKTLPLLGRAFGQGVREARKEIDEIKHDGASSDGTSNDGTSSGGGTPA